MIHLPGIGVETPPGSAFPGGNGSAPGLVVPEAFPAGHTWTRARTIGLLVIALASGLTACGGDTAAAPSGPGDSEAISAVARAYLTAVLDTMEAHSLKRREIDWPSFRTETFAFAGAARTAADTYESIRDAIRRLGDGHSFFLDPVQAQGGLAPTAPGTARGSEAARGSVAPTAAAPPTGRRINSRIGYIDMPGFSSIGKPTSAITEHAEQYHDLISPLDTTTVCGWVVDLRLNGGGNMWPMLAGIGPILGEGEVGRFVDPDGDVQDWFYRNGTSGITQIGVVTSVSNEYRLATEDPPVAVLTRDNTISSGEAITVAFRGRPDTRSFGEPTLGLSTANQGFPLSDGAVLFLAVSTFADRTGQLYGGPIPPDSLIFGSKTGSVASDTPLAAAVAWLEARPACAP